MQHLTFGPIEPYDISGLQQMVQGTAFSCLYFNAYAPTILVARCDGDIAGFTVGQKGYGDQSHILIIQGTFLRHRFSDEHHEHELQLAFMNWAAEKLGVTHYKIDEFDPPIPIAITHIISAPAPVLEDEIISAPSLPDYALQ